MARRGQFDEDEVDGPGPGNATRPSVPGQSPTLPCPPGQATAAQRLPAPSLGDDCWILSGPTASGKTALAIGLARRLDAEIVSVDSMAVYRGLDIGTAKPSPADRAAVPHHLVDVVEPADCYSVARWLAAAAAAVEEIRRRGRRVLFVGGTPLYLRALCDGLDPLPPADPALRQRLAAELEAEGSAALHRRLATLDPAAAVRIHPHDARRIVRALEVAGQGSTSRATAWAGGATPSPAFARQMMVIDLPRALLRARIDRRVEEMFSQGLVAETRAAAERPGGIGATAAQAAGYAEALAVIAGRIDEAAALRQVQTRTRQLAKRQLTWLRSFPDAVWITA